MKIIRFDQSKKIKISTNIVIILILLLILSSFCQYYSMKLNFKNPLIPEKLIEIATKPFLNKAITLSVGIIIMVIMKYFKRNLFALCIGILLIVYYVFSNHYIGGWNTQI